MKKFFGDNLVFIIPGALISLGLIFFLVYSLYENDWEYTLGMIFWTLAIFSIPVTAGIYKLVLKIKK